MSDSFLCQLCRSFSSIMSQQFKIKFHSSFPNFVPATIPYNEKVKQGSYRFFRSCKSVFVLGINLQQNVGVRPAGRRSTSKLTSCSVLFDFCEKLRAAFVLFGSNSRRHLVTLDKKTKQVFKGCSEMCLSTVQESQM